MALTKQNQKPSIVAKQPHAQSNESAPKTGANNIDSLAVVAKKEAEERKQLVNGKTIISKQPEEEGEQTRLLVEREQQLDEAASGEKKVKWQEEQQSVGSQHSTDSSSSNEQKQSHQSEEISLTKKLAIDSVLVVIKSLITLYDLITLPVYYVKHRVYQKYRDIVLVKRSCQLDPDDPNSPWHQIYIEPRHKELEDRIDSFETYDQVMKATFKVYGSDRLCYGYREVLHEQWTKRPDSDKLFKQVKLSPYKWITFEQFELQIEAARKGFLIEGIRAGDKVMLYADTRPEWQIASQALIRLGAIVGTMYSTLGVDGIVHSVNETQVTHVVSQKDKVSKLLKLKPKLTKLAKIIYFEPSLRLRVELGGQLEMTNGQKANGKLPNNDKMETKDELFPKDFEHNQVECVNFCQLLCKGLDVSEREISKLEEENRLADEKMGKRSKESIAVIMYTSGSTGIPKGVLISHGNIMATIKSFSYVTKDFVHQPLENCCTAYLPLAHIFEFCIESVMLYHGVKYGFATPHTLTDKSPGLLPGQEGDLSVLQPSVMIIVPLILDRIVQGVKQALKEQSYFKEQLVSYLINYKIYWQKKFYETPLVDKIVCSKISKALGGKAKFVICGSAPLSGETQNFVRAALNIKVPQGFGTTETTAATTCQLFEDQSICNVGPPVAGSLIKLEPWIEGNYRPTDRPNPRGEIVVGGGMIAHGYFNLDEQTKEAFYVDEQGVRWYRTGDIGEFLPNGNLKIIDRKKDLVKLQNGEYISLGKVESTLKSNPFTDNFCVYANSKYNYVVALGPANGLSIRNLAQQLVDEASKKTSPSMVIKNEERKRVLRMSEREHQDALDELKEVLSSYETDKLNNNQDEAEDELARLRARKMSSLSTNSNAPGASTDPRLERLCQNPLVRGHILAYIKSLAEERNLLSLEVPKKVLLLAEEWTEDKNLVTAAMKIRRNFIYKRYEQELEQLYSSS